MSLIRQFVAVFGITTLMRRALPRLGPAVLVATQASCAMSNSEPSQVGQSKKYVTGQAKFDAFFAALHEHQLKLSKAPAEEQGVRRNFARELAENEQASASALGKAVRKRVEHR